MCYMEREALLVAKGTTRSDASSGFKLSKWGNYDTMKFSDSPGKENPPGEPTLFQTPDGRRVGQVGEDIGEDMFVPAYRYPGKILLPDSLEGMYERAQRTHAHIEHQVQRRDKTEHSQKTKENCEENKRTLRNINSPRRATEMPPSVKELA
jgi:hypothetical protein